MNSAFNEQVLADKLAKLNSTQQCIETLSHWCIFHRKKAEQVVQTWDKAFHSSEKEQKIPLLYLANDILQNSRRNGTEFVEEFWKVLPGTLKSVVETGDDHGKNVVSRLVRIWEERRVFGSRAKGLTDLMLGNEPPPALELNKKRSRSVRIVKRDSRSVKLKLSVGGTAEKIISALHSVQSEHSTEDSDLNKCKDAVRRVGKMEKDVAAACMQEGDPRRVRLAEELQEEEATLKMCMEKLKSVESNRVALISQLKEVLQEQESDLEIVRTQLQVAQARVDEAANMRRRLNNEPIVVQMNPPSASEVSKKTAAAIAAEVADKLAASSRSQQIMTSVLSTFAAEEAKNAASASGSLSEAPLDRLKHENPLPGPSTTGYVSVPLQHQAVLVQQAPIQNQGSTPQPPYNLYPGPAQQYLQPTGGVMIGVPYTYGNLPPPPPPPQMLNLARPGPLPQQQPMANMIQQQGALPPQMALQQPPMQPLNQQPAQLSLQQPAPPSYRPLQPPGMAFFHHQSQ